DDDVHAVGHLALLHDLLATRDVARLQLARQPAHLGGGQREKDRDSLQQLEPFFELGGLGHWFRGDTVARNARISRLKDSGVHGLAMNPSQPAARAARSYIGMGWAVSAMTGMAAVSESAFSSLVNSRPSMPGSWMSMRIRSGVFVASTSRASSADPAPTTTKPSFSRMTGASIRLPALSSTIRISGGLLMAESGALAAPA